MIHERLVAHRGYAGRHPENTSVAVAAAVELGARFIEIDVQITRDEEVVLFHDRDLGRLCGRSGAVHEQTLGELSRLTVREDERLARAGVKCAPQPIALLRDVVADLARRPRAPLLFVEIKRVAVEAHGNSRAAELVLAALAGLAGRCALISFDFAVLRQVRARGDTPIGPVLTRWNERLERTYRDLAPEWTFCNVERLPADGSLGLAVGELVVYELVAAAPARALLDRGAALIETFELETLSAGLQRADAEDR